MNRCEYYQELISRMLDGDLSKSERDELAAHVKSCPDCAAVYVAFRSLSENIGEDLQEPPRSLQANIMAEVRREQIRKNSAAASRAHRRWHYVLAAAACLVLVVAAGLSLPKIAARKNAAQEAPAAAEFSVAAEPPALGAPLPAPEEAATADGMLENRKSVDNSMSTAADMPAEAPADAAYGGVADEPMAEAEESAVAYEGVVTKNEDGTLILDEAKSQALIEMLTRKQTMLSGTPTHELHLFYLRDGKQTPMTVLLTEKESVYVFAGGDSYYLIDSSPEDLLSFLEPEE